MRHKIFNPKQSWLWITILYLLTHMTGLLALPVFADEAISLRWGQLIIAEPLRFVFFSMSDGKPPLFMWILSVTLRFFQDPLVAGRVTSLLIGLATVFVVGKSARLVSGSRRVALFSELIVVFAPFWWTYHRLALMDGLLTLCITLSFYFALKIVIRCQKERGIAYDTIPLVLLLATSFGGAMLTKTPALFAIPLLAGVPLFSLVRVDRSTRTVRAKLFESTILIAIGGVIGCVLFLFLRISPFFGTLFARSSDFTFSLADLLHGEWRYVLFASMPRESVWISTYMTYGVIFAGISGLLTRKRKTIAILFLYSLVFAIPLIALGRVLYPRYFLPVAPFLTIAGAIGLDALFRGGKKTVFGWFLILLFCLQSALFILPSVTDVSRIPFVPIDSVQYLEEWSAGFGNSEVRDYIKQRFEATHRPIIVLTEGAFGTLPDGLLMYFFGPNQIDGVEIHGIGVGPSEIPEEFLSQSTEKEIYYMVNSHRLKLTRPDRFEKVLDISRPKNGPHILLFRLR